MIHAKAILTPREQQIFPASLLTTAALVGMIVAVMLCFVVAGKSIAAEQNSATEATADGEYAAVVTMTDSLQFVPKKITIEAGQTVLWKNKPSEIAHTVTCDPGLAEDKDNVQLPEGAKTFNSGEMQPGDTFTHTFKTAGEYTYFCIPHEAAGMVARVTVKPPSNKSAPPADENDAAPTSDGDSLDHDDSPQTAATSDEDQQDQSADASATDNGAPDDDEANYVLGAHRPPRPPGAESATGLLKFAYWLGSFHPPATDLPVGLAMAALLSEALRVVSKREGFMTITRFCVWVAAASGLAAGILGWCLAGFRFEDPAWLLDRHRWFGTGTALWLPITAVLMEVSIRRERTSWRRVFQAALLIAVVLIGVTGYFGGAMIYGIDHYAWPN